MKGFSGFYHCSSHMALLCNWDEVLGTSWGGLEITQAQTTVLSIRLISTLPYSSSLTEERGILVHRQGIIDIPRRDEGIVDFKNSSLGQAWKISETSAEVGLFTLSCPEFRSLHHQHQQSPIKQPHPGTSIHRTLLYPTSRSSFQNLHTSPRTKGLLRQTFGQPVIPDLCL